MNTEATPLHDPDFECAVIAALAAGPPVVLVYVRALETRNEELRRWIAQHEEERAAVARALKNATDAAGTTSMHGQGRR